MTGSSVDHVHPAWGRTLDFVWVVGMSPRHELYTDHNYRVKVDQSLGQDDRQLGTVCRSVLDLSS